MSTLSSDEPMHASAVVSAWDVCGGVLVLLVFLVPVALIVVFLHHLCRGNVPLPYMNVDPMLFRIAGAG